MATITDYSTLQSTIADYLNRSDLSSQIQTFIQFAEADLNTRLRCREMIVRAEVTSNQEYIDLPADWLEGINVHISDGTSPLRYVTLDEADRVNKQQTFTKPMFYSIMDGAMQIVPPQSADIDLVMVYYSKIPALSDAVTTNWLLTKAPDVYLYGALSHSAPFLMDDARMATFGQVYLARVQSLIDEASKSLHSGSPLIARAKVAY